MIGPVFALEWLRAGRRGRAHVLRWLCGGWLLLQFLIAYRDYLDRDNALGAPAVLASFAKSFLDLVLVQQFLAVVLVTPALVAGSITEEKTRRTLEQLLTTHLGSIAIVAGKLLARTADVLVLALVALPMAAFIGPYAGAGPEFIFGQALVAALAAFGLSGVSILASVWSRQTRTAVLAVYVLIVAAMLWLRLGWLPVPAWAAALNPVWVLAPAWDRSNIAAFGQRLEQCALVWGSLGAGCTLLAAWRLRPAMTRQLAARSRRWTVGHWLPRPRPAWNPLVWKERYVGRMLPLWLGLSAAAAVSVWLALRDYAATAKFEEGAARVPVDTLIERSWYVLGFLTLFVGLRASGTIVGERERQTWDGLLTTPMTPRELIRGKLRGILASAWPYLLVYLLTSAATAAFCARDNRLVTASAALLAAATAVGFILVLGPRSGRPIIVVLAALWAFVASSATAIAIVIIGLLCWLAMEFLASVGIWASVRCKSSLRSLLMTLGLGYVGGFVIFCVSTPLACATTMVLSVVAGLLDFVIVTISDSAPRIFSRAGNVEALLPLFFAVGVALTYWWFARSMLVAAEAYLARTERIPSGRARIIDLDLPYKPNRRAVWQ